MTTYLITKSGEVRAKCDDNDCACDLAEDIALAGSDAEVRDAYSGDVVYQAFADKPHDVAAAREKRETEAAEAAALAARRQQVIADAIALNITQDELRGVAQPVTAEVARG